MFSSSQAERRRGEKQARRVGKETEFLCVLCPRLPEWFRRSRIRTWCLIRSLRALHCFATRIWSALKSGTNPDRLGNLRRNSGAAWKLARKLWTTLGKMRETPEQLLRDSLGTCGETPRHLENLRGDPGPPWELAGKLPDRLAWEPGRRLRDRLA